MHAKDHTRRLLKMRVTARTGLVSRCKRRGTGAGSVIEETSSAIDALVRTKNGPSRQERLRTGGRKCLVFRRRGISSEGNGGIMRMDYKGITTVVGKIKILGRRKYDCGKNPETVRQGLGGNERDLVVRANGGPDKEGRALILRN